MRIPILDLGKSFSQYEFEKLVRAKGGSHLLGCKDKDCCPHGIEDMVKNWRNHFVNQRQKQIRSLKLIPDHNRAQHFLEVELANADRKARRIEKLNTGDEKLTQILVKHGMRLERLHETLANCVGY